jgi:hypothetical protein
MLVQKLIKIDGKIPLAVQPMSRADYRKFDQHIKDALKKEFELIHDRVLQVMRDMPGPMLLIFR